MKLPHRAFRSWRTSAALNVVAVGASLAALTGFVFRTLLDMHESTFAAISTFIVGVAWAAAVRVKPKQGGMRVGWLLSPVFACLNSMLCVALITIGEGHALLDSLAIIIFGGGLFGAMIWVPALILTLLFFGLPIARAQAVAARGLAGTDRGEIIVGMASAFIALIPIFWSAAPLELILAALAAVAGTSASVLSVVRERARRAFVRDVEAGNVAQFRVEPSAEGKVLVRVTTTGIAYRVSDFVEEIATLNEENEVLSTHETNGTSIVRPPGDVSQA